MNTATWVILIIVTSPVWVFALKVVGLLLLAVFYPIARLIEDWLAERRVRQRFIERQTETLEAHDKQVSNLVAKFEQDRSAIRDAYLSAESVIDDILNGRGNM